MGRSKSAVRRRAQCAPISPVDLAAFFAWKWADWVREAALPMSRRAFRSTRIRKSLP